MRKRAPAIFAMRFGFRTRPAVGQCKSANGFALPLRTALQGKEFHRSEQEGGAQNQAGVGGQFAQFCVHEILLAIAEAAAILTAGEEPRQPR